MSIARGWEYLLTLSRPDKPGIVCAVSSCPSSIRRASWPAARVRSLIMVSRLSCPASRRTDQESLRQR